MPLIHIETLVAASPQRCFDLARNVDIHQQSTAASQERAVDGVTSGLMALGDTVTWEAIHFGLRMRLTSRITEFEPPHRFVDEMVKGPFHHLHHLHRFQDLQDSPPLLAERRHIPPPLHPARRLAGTPILGEGRVGALETLMIDDFDYASPLGVLGWLADRLVVRRYLERFLRDRNAFIKLVAERGE